LPTDLVISPIYYDLFSKRVFVLVKGQSMV
jgi:hypothetical protein